MEKGKKGSLELVIGLGKRQKGFLKVGYRFEKTTNSSLGIVSFIRFGKV